MYIIPLGSVLLTAFPSTHAYPFRLMGRAALPSYGSSEGNAPSRGA